MPRKSDRQSEVTWTRPPNKAALLRFASALGRVLATHDVENGISIEERFGIEKEPAQE